MSHLTLASRVAVVAVAAALEGEAVTAAAVAVERAVPLAVAAVRRSRHRSPPVRPA
ncbi:hypothetical protein [Mycobacterium paragordonae]|uniref:hypothetical protein n=1 Tax=Mycobacterium paragordonae TaxID=1389713 RepID=UPI0028058B8D|nr:hypothetical protein [Mycobacterium paragordonae]